MSTELEIIQDSEFDEDGLGGLLLSFWAYGHGHDADQFVRAVVAHTLEMHGSVPRIDCDDEPVELWQRVIERGDSLEYQRQATKPEGRLEWVPITLLDLHRPSRGNTKCGVERCYEPWNAGIVVRVCIEANENVTLARLWFCSKHTRQFPEPLYRVCMIPVGATILLSEAEQLGGQADG